MSSNFERTIIYPLKTYYQAHNFLRKHNGTKTSCEHGCDDKTRTQKQVCEIFSTKYPDHRISQSTVSRIENKFREFGNVTDITKSGRKRILDDEQKLDILLDIQDNPHKPPRIRQVAADNDKQAEFGYSGVFRVADQNLIWSEIDPGEPEDPEPWSPGPSSRFSLEFGPKLNENAYFQDIIDTIPRISKQMGLTIRVPGPPGVTDNKTNDVFMISDPKNPPAEFEGKTLRMRLVTRVPGPQVYTPMIPQTVLVREQNVFVIICLFLLIRQVFTTTFSPWQFLNPSRQLKIVIGENKSFKSIVKKI
ncbi:hypothetical protein NQ318_023146 [Aromia moschata]|uniref:DUF4817 domain-containing protein n=1 Tax=Aromia moschata TaxID=1265417 RepID=A0AAV8XDY4_9CUCU|nr:hypothetical protein NQ318_023146 [Aromia moschata]